MSNVRRTFSDSMLLADLIRVARRMELGSLSQTQYSIHGRFGFVTYCRRFGSWNAALRLAELEPVREVNISQQEVIEDLQRVAKHVGSSRLTADQYRLWGKHTVKVPRRCFGKWQLALAAAGLTPGNKRKLTVARGPRTVNLRLRFAVLSRDQFRCRACGRSPATHPELSLQIDHIVPWSNGGATVESNLQTLCDQCNMGKSNVW